MRLKNIFILVTQSHPLNSINHNVNPRFFFLNALSHETYSSLDLTKPPNNLNSNMGYHTNRAPIVTPQHEKLKENFSFDDVNHYSTNDAEHNFGNFTAHNSLLVRDARRWRICSSFGTVVLTFLPINGILI